MTSDTVMGALDALTDSNIADAARATLRGCELPRMWHEPARQILEASLRWTISAVRNLPTEDLVAPTLADGGRGLRGEVWDDYDADRHAIELDLLVLLLEAQHLDIQTCPVPEHSDASDTCEMILAEAPEILFTPVVAAVRVLPRHYPGSPIGVRVPPLAVLVQVYGGGRSRSPDNSAFQRRGTDFLLPLDFPGADPLVVPRRCDGRPGRWREASAW